MSEQFIKRALIGAVTFHEINQKIIDWNYSDLEGEGFYYKLLSGRYGHVKLKISKIENFDNILIEWNNNAQIPENFREIILKTLGFFVSYIEGLKGKQQSLKIEIIDGSSHSVDSSNLGYEIATKFALHDCFGNLKKEISESDRKLIARFKEK